MDNSNTRDHQKNTRISPPLLAKKFLIFLSFST